MSNLSAKETAFFESVDLDPALVGPEIGRGAQHLVRDFKDGKEVVKIPRYLNGGGLVSLLTKYAIPRGYDAAKRQADLCEEYFGTHMAPTRIQANAKRDVFCILQKKITPMLPVTPAACAKSHIRDQMHEVLESNEKLGRDEGVFLDMMGYDFWKIAKFFLRAKPYMDNVVIDGNDRNVTVIDTGLLQLPQKRRMSPYLRSVLAVQNINAWLFGLSYDGKPHRQAAKSE